MGSYVDPVRPVCLWRPTGGTNGRSEKGTLVPWYFILYIRRDPQKGRTDEAKRELITCSLGAWRKGRSGTTNRRLKRLIRQIIPN